MGVRQDDPLFGPGGLAVQNPKNTVFSRKLEKSPFFGTAEKAAP